VYCIDRIDIVNRAVGMLHVDSATPASSSSYASTVKSGGKLMEVLCQTCLTFDDSTQTWPSDWSGVLQLG